MASRRSRRVLGVTLVSQTPDPVIEAYLRRAGVSTHTARNVEQAPEMVPPSAAAVVFFADDFSRASLLSAIAAVRAHRPTALVVVVTAEPAAFLTLQENRALVLPKPAWGWTILDAIRAQLEPAERRSFVDRLGRFLRRD